MSKIKEIWCMQHSHLDIGYTHPQPLLLELQKDYIDQAIDLCVKTKDYPEEARFRWTCEATFPLMRWLETASEERTALLKELIKEGRFCVAAMPMHTTPGCTAPEMIEMLSDLDTIRETLGAKINTAINHDVNGQPWTLSQVMLDSNIDFYLTGINIHFGGIPMPRPAAFRWETPDKRELLTFVGEHYSLFSQFFFTDEASTSRMHEGILNYVARLEKSGYNRDFLFLTATNPPLYDNNSPDLELPDVIRKYNEEGHEFVVRYATPEMLRERIMEEGVNSLPVHAGDWTDFWNFGSASTARETRVNRRGKQNIQKAEMLESFVGSPNKQYDSVKKESMLNSLIFDEHTWGASQSITAFHSPETYSQFIHKVKTAYQSADLSAYLLSTQVEGLVGNEHQANGIEGVVVVNTSGVKQKMSLKVPKYYLDKGRHLSALRTKEYLPYITNKLETINFGEIEMSPYSYRKIPFTKLTEMDFSNLESIEVGEGEVKTPFYDIKFNKVTGRISQVYAKGEKWNILNENSEWSFFELVRETVDDRFNKQNRATLFPRDVDLGNQNITQWNHNWVAKREGANKVLNWSIDKKDDTVSFVFDLEIEGMEKFVQTITFSASSSNIKVHLDLIKSAISTPESIYFTLPLNMNKDWESSYDTASQFVKLDTQQIGTVCRDWVTVDKSVSIYDNEKGISLFCPDAPMVQIGDFNFGRENKAIKRQENPILLAWPLNNYWDTNFMANQSGAMEFEYEIKPFENFSAIETFESSLNAENPCVIGAIANCVEEEYVKFVEGEGKVSSIYLKPSKFASRDNRSFVLVLKNFDDAVQEYSFTTKHFDKFKVETVNIQEEVIENVALSGDNCKVKLSAGELLLVRVTEVK